QDPGVRVSAEATALLAGPDTLTARESFGRVTAKKCSAPKANSPTKIANTSGEAAAYASRKTTESTSAMNGNTGYAGAMNGRSSWGCFLRSTNSETMLVM